MAGLLDSQETQQPSPGTPVTLPNGLQGVWGVDASGKYVIYDINTWDGSNPQVIGYAGPTGAPVAGAPLPNGGSAAAPPPAPATPTMKDWQLPMFPTTYAAGKGIGMYEGLGQQMAFDLNRQLQHDPTAQQFGRFDFAQQMTGGWPPNTPNVPPITPPTTYPPSTTGGGSGGGGGGGGIGGVPGLGGFGHPPGTPGTTTGNPLERGGGGIGGVPGLGVPGHPSGNPGTTTGNPLERGGANTPIPSPSGGTGAPSRPRAAADVATPAVSSITPQMYGLLASTPAAARSGLLGTADARAPSSGYTPPTMSTANSMAALAPGGSTPARVGTLEGFRFSGNSPYEKNYNWLADNYGSQAARAYFAVNSNQLQGPLGASTQGNKDLMNLLINTSGAGGQGSLYSGGGQSNDGSKFWTTLPTASAQQMGWSPLSNTQNGSSAGLYSVALPYATDPYGYAGTPLGNLMAQYGMLGAAPKLPGLPSNGG